MVNILFILIVLIINGIIIYAGFIKIIPTLKPVEKPHVRIEDKMMNADATEYPISDSEFEQVKKSYGSTEGAGIAIFVIALVVFWLLLIFTWDFFDMPIKAVCILFHLAACIIWLVSFLKKKRIFKKDRDCFRKKTAYLLDDDVKTYYSRKYRGGHYAGVRAVDAYHVMVGILDENGKPQAYIMQVGPDIYNHLKKNGVGDAILYKGTVSGLALPQR
ncbi:MAG: hypothetical protein IJ040_00395 [Lachnospiraceae bacterium]|nr:hypothetical protein [Lachnospiraceae bacterium]